MDSPTLNSVYLFLLFNPRKASIVYGGERHRLGRFESREQAALAYDEQARKRAPAQPLNFEHFFKRDPAAEILQRLAGGLTGSQLKMTLASLRDACKGKDVKSLGFLRRRAFCSVCHDQNLPWGPGELRSLLEEYDPEWKDEVRYPLLVGALSNFADFGPG